MIFVLDTALDYVVILLFASSTVFSFGGYNIIYLRSRSPGWRRRSLGIFFMNRERVTHVVCGW